MGIKSHPPEYWLEKALVLAKEAGDKGEVPVGAILIADGELVASGHNQSITMHDPTAHAEICAIRAAGLSLQNYRLLNTTLYITLEPCMMCVGAIIQARIKHVVFAARDPKAGAVVSQYTGFDAPFINHSVEYDHGYLSEHSRSLLQTFFQQARLRNKRLI